MKAPRVRILSNLLGPRSKLRRRFPSHALTAIEEAVEACAQKHRAEVRVVIELSLDVRTLLRTHSAHERALEIFAEHAVVSTRERNGVLIYVLLAESAVEIVADRGFDGRVTDDEWQSVCALIQQQFALGRYRDGLLLGIEAVTPLLVRAFPASGPSTNEQHDRPAVL